MEPRKVLVVGAAGEIGGELTRRLPDELARAHPGGGYELVAADRRPLLPEVARGFDGTFVDRYTEACAGIDTVVHLAGERPVRSVAVRCGGRC